MGVNYSKGLPLDTEISAYFKSSAWNNLSVWVEPIKKWVKLKHFREDVFYKWSSERREEYDGQKSSKRHKRSPPQVQDATKNVEMGREKDVNDVEMGREKDVNDVEMGREKDVNDVEMGETKAKTTKNVFKVVFDGAYSENIEENIEEIDEEMEDYVTTALGGGTQDNPLTVDLTEGSEDEKLKETPENPLFTLASAALDVNSKVIPPPPIHATSGPFKVDVVKPLSAESKECRRCKVVKNLDQYYKVSETCRRSECKTCCRKQCRENYRRKKKQENNKK
jgi:hypothetical protein